MKTLGLEATRANKAYKTGTEHYSLRIIQGLLNLYEKEFETILAEYRSRKRNFGV